MSSERAVICKQLVPRERLLDLSPDIEYLVEQVAKFVLDVLLRGLPHIEHVEVFGDDDGLLVLVKVDAQRLIHTILSILQCSLSGDV